MVRYVVCLLCLVCLFVKRYVAVGVKNVSKILVHTSNCKIHKSFCKIERIHCGYLSLTSGKNNNKKIKNRRNNKYPWVE